MRTMESRLRGHLWPIAATLITFVIAANAGRLGSTQVMNARFSPLRMPVNAVSFLNDAMVGPESADRSRARTTTGPIFSPDYWGGYLIYRLFPRAQVVVDDRHDFYGEAFLRPYLTTIHAEPGWEDFLRVHHVSCVVLPRDSALATVLTNTTSWKKIYGDAVSTVFVPTPARE